MPWPALPPSAPEIRPVLRPVLHLMRRLVSVALGIALVGALHNQAHAFGFDDVAQRAKQLAAAPPHDVTSNLPPELSTEKLSYDQYRDIRFKPDQARWHNERLPYELAYFHQGRYFNEPVKINEVRGNVVQPIVFDATQFDYGKNRFDQAAWRKAGGLGYAGFRVHYPLNRKNYKDEVIAFLGASYFRALGKAQQYGVSARGLAVDTALSAGEEFPRFVEFWLVLPDPGDTQLTFYGLLDSKRLSGAYRFTLRPGVDTQVDVKARVYLRDNVGKLGMAPLTSMFMFGENQRASGEDYRPEVHDSDGLSIHTGNGEWIWRPLQNPARLLVTSFAMRDPRGFGLMQRDRNFAHYEDLEAHYQARPSVWVEPLGRWGSGRVELVQIPVPDETNDNIVAYWVPDVTPAIGQAADFSYRLHWQSDGERPRTAWVEQTRRGHGYRQTPDDSVHLLVDFAGPLLQNLTAATPPRVAASTDGNGKLLDAIPFKNDITGGWRLAIRLRRADPAKPTEIRAQLIGRDNQPSETWSYILPPA